MKRALVLSGGGARGSYQIGVWKALNELNIKFDIVTGTSVGALNGAMYVQNSFDEAKELWKKINYKEVFSDPFFTNDDIAKTRMKIFIKYLKTSLNKKKLSADSLKNNIENLLDNDKFYNSNIDYGLVIYNIKKKEPLMITKKDIEHGLLSNYLVASATVYPIFEKKKINDCYYVDGGYYDNLPINLAEQMGATEVVAVYIGVFGIRKPTINKDLKITYIKPKSKLGMPFHFNNTFASKNMKLGYNDTMKVYHKLDGKYFSFNNKELHLEYDKCKDYINTNISKCKLKGTVKKEKISYNDFVNGVELLGKLFNLDESKIYSIDEYNEKIKHKFDSKNIRFTSRSIINRMKKICSNLIDINKNKRKNVNKINFNFVIASIYLYKITNKKS